MHGCAVMIYTARCAVMIYSLWLMRCNLRLMRYTLRMMRCNLRLMRYTLLRDDIPTCVE